MKFNSNVIYYEKSMIEESSRKSIRSSLFWEQPFIEYLERLGDRIINIQKYFDSYNDEKKTITNKHKEANNFADLYV